MITNFGSVTKLAIPTQIFLKTASNADWVGISKLLFYAEPFPFGFLICVLSRFN